MLCVRAFEQKGVSSDFTVEEKKEIIENVQNTYYCEVDVRFIYYKQAQRKRVFYILRDIYSLTFERQRGPGVFYDELSGRELEQLVFCETGVSELPYKD